jgi:hypothetical protein
MNVEMLQRRHIPTFVCWRMISNTAKTAFGFVVTLMQKHTSIRLHNDSLEGVTIIL